MATSLERVHSLLFLFATLSKLLDIEGYRHHLGLYPETSLYGAKNARACLTVHTKYTFVNHK